MHMCVAQSMILNNASIPENPFYENQREKGKSRPVLYFFPSLIPSINRVLGFTFEQNCNLFRSSNSKWMNNWTNGILVFKF